MVKKSEQARLAWHKALLEEQEDEFRRGYQAASDAIAKQISELESWPVRARPLPTN